MKKRPATVQFLFQVMLRDREVDRGAGRDGQQDPGPAFVQESRGNEIDKDRSADVKSK